MNTHASSACMAWLGLLALALPAGAAAQAAAATPAVEMHVHEVVRGDTLAAISQRYLATTGRWPEIAALNGVRDPRRLPIGRKLSIPFGWMRTQTATAAITAVSGAVKSGTYTATPGTQVTEGGVVSTGESGNAVIKLVDGTVLRLRANTRVRIETSRTVPAVNAVRAGVQLEQGRVEVEAARARAGHPGFRIGTPTGVLGVRGTEFRAASDARGTLTEVLGGAVAASGRAAEELVTAGYGTVIDASGAVAAPSALPPAPRLAGALPERLEHALVRVAIEPVPDARQYRVQVAADEGFDFLLFDALSPSPELRVPGLADGRYALRVRAIDAKGLEGRDLVTAFVLKARPEPPMPSRPAPRALIGGERAGVAWTAAESAATYRVQLARADAAASGSAGGSAGGATGGSGAADRVFAQPLRDLTGVAGTQLELDGLAPGRYVWRVASVKADGDQGPFGDAQGFEMRALPAQPTGQPPLVDDTTARFAWTGLPGQTFDFQLAGDPSFAALRLERQVDRPEFVLPFNGLGLGSYFVRFRARDADGFVGPWSATQRFEILAPCVSDGSGGCVSVSGGRLLRP